MGSKGKKRMKTTPKGDATYWIGEMGKILRGTSLREKMSSILERSNVRCLSNLREDT
jgi:hypothetical protein